ncbi:HAD family hydrolase [Fontisphaera persica]|uniref:HAD family hydrolase n=1 Tax=Fontisphaera persica TaxID=2974023 RepID=UPI0024BF2FD5|nr:HAD family hydrolase [Fontisphaera persica]WCJ59273.1 HAD family hydrolase [Fontisphaera persica]
MEHCLVKPRAVILDVYETLLMVGPPPPDAENQWLALWGQFFRQPPPLSLAEFGLTCERWIREEHAQAHVRGIPFPEVYWPRIACLTAPDLAALEPAALEAFLLAQARIWHQVCLAEGAAETLRWLRGQGLYLGIASNAQAYTVAELNDALQHVGLDLSLFHPRLQFWSFEHGFSKPDPHVFRLLQARLWALDVVPEAVLMVGDSLENDIQPAREQGWQTWHLGDRGTGADGRWPQLHQALAGAP